MSARATTPPTIVRLGGHEIRVSHADRVVFPDPQPPITKGEIVEYYRRAAPAMLPHLKGRPLMLQRLPEGLGGEVFYQKEISSYYPEWIHRVTVGKRGGTVTHVVCDDAATLVYLANQAVITPHPWLSRADAIDRPDRLIFDLDPSTDDVADVRFAARAMGELLREVGFEPHLMATGSRGFHVTVAIRREEPFPVVHEVALGLAEALTRRAPDRLTIEFSKAQRGERVFVDFHRNTYAQTAVPPYAVRPRPDAPVAVPLAWEELDAAKPDGWTVRTVLDRLGQFASRPNPWAGFGRHPRSIARARRWLAREGGA
jgi:bifunctional non-homologous end joining protein LigD